MTTRTDSVQPNRPATQRKQPVKKQNANPTKVNKNEPSVGELLINRGAAIVLTPLAATAGTLTIFGAAVNGIVNPNTTFDKSMTEGIKAAGQGADMLEKMWEGRYF